MMSADIAIARIRRDLTLGSLLNAGLLVSIFLCVLLGGAINSRFGDVIVLACVAVIWMTLGYRSLRGTRLAARSPSLIASGQFDLAEFHIEQAVRMFSLFRSSKLLSLHHFAVLRHAQGRHQDAADLSSALLRQRLGALKGLARQSRLILADSLLELGDLNGSHRAIEGLYDQRLSLAEALSLLNVQLDYQWRINAWEPMLEGVANKVQLAELMNTASGARTQAFLALAALRLGRADWMQWLRRRVELLVDVRELTAGRPVLKELWPDATA